MKEYFKNENGILYHGDALDVSKVIEPNSVHCIVTSPPYWGKRDYFKDGELSADRALGLEVTPQEYVTNIVKICREMREVLHPLGTFWLNIEDTNCVPSTKRQTKLGMKPGVPVKNRILIPYRLALALQEDGWWVRADIIWYKRNAQRRAVKDRPTYEHEYLFLLTKKAHYFYDHVAVMQPLIASDYYQGDRDKIEIESDGMSRGGRKDKGKLEGRNLGTVWDIPTQPRTDWHYAAFPDELARMCIKAGTSKKGYCSKCNAPIGVKYKRDNYNSIPKQIWKPSCKCNADINKSCIVLDPFMGRGTVGLIAEELGRNWIGIEKSEVSCDLIASNFNSKKYGLLPPIDPPDGFFNLTREDIKTR